MSSSKLYKNESGLFVSWYFSYLVDVVCIFDIIGPSLSSKNW